MSDRFYVFMFIWATALSISSCGASSDHEKASSKTVVNLGPVDSSLVDISLPPGFRIDYYARDIKNARQMCLSESGTLYVGTRKHGSVYALQDTDGDMVADKKYTLLEDMNLPNGVAMRQGTLYIAEVNRIIAIDDIEDRLSDNMDYRVVYDGYPDEVHHGWKFIAFGPDDLLYVPVGAPCNICESEDPIFNTITRLAVDGSEPEIVQRGVRNTVGFTWHPDTDELWFTDNGRDWMGDDSPACELNHAPSDDMHFGYPYCHAGDMPDPEFGEKFPCSDFVAPAQNLGPHVAPLGLEIYSGTQFPEEYDRAILIAEHGSWNRTDPIGYRLSMVRLDEAGESKGYEMFATGWLRDGEEKPWGRPVDLEPLPDGSMLVSDDHGDAIYRISYVGQ